MVKHDFKVTTTWEGGRESVGNTEEMSSMPLSLFQLD